MNDNNRQGLRRVSVSEKYSFEKTIEKHYFSV